MPARSESDLTDDEFAVLLIAAQGESMMPIGRWEQSVKSLAARGLLEMADSVNFFITAAGREAVRARDQADDRALGQAIQRFGGAMQVQVNIQEFVEQAAQLLAQAAQISHGITSDAEEVAARKWSRVILDRALEVLRAR